MQKQQSTFNFGVFHVHYTAQSFDFWNFFVLLSQENSLPHFLLYMRFLLKDLH